VPGGARNPGGVRPPEHHSRRFGAAVTLRAKVPSIYAGQAANQVNRVPTAGLEQPFPKLAMTWTYVIEGDPLGSH
jgi:hypothetical protein